MTANIVLVLVFDPGARIFRTGFFQSVMDLTAPQGLLPWVAAAMLMPAGARTVKKTRPTEHF
jgi:hypothetical protein